MSYILVTVLIPSTVFFWSIEPEKPLHMTRAESRVHPNASVLCLSVLLLGRASPRPQCGRHVFEFCLWQTCPRAVACVILLVLQASEQHPAYTAHVACLAARRPNCTSATARAA